MTPAESVMLLAGSCAMHLTSPVDYFMKSPVSDLVKWQAVIMKLKPPPEEEQQGGVNEYVQRV